jgi:hypothetical protein
MTSQQEADALLHAFWREREQKTAPMPRKAPGIVPEFVEAKHRHKADHADNIQFTN